MEKSKFCLQRKWHILLTTFPPRYGIMEKLKRLQDGEDVAELLAEIDDEMPSEEEEEEEEDPEEYGLTEVQKKVGFFRWI